MLTNIKALLVVLVIAGLVFHLVKPLCLRFMAEEDFVRRRLVWMLLNGFAFISPNFWIFVLFAGPLLVWAQRKDPNPAALFLLAITTAPPVTLAIPTVGIGALFDLSLPRLLALTVLLPAVLAHASTKDKTRSKAVVVIDYCIAAFVLVQLVVLLPYDSFTNILRRGLHFVLDFALIYYAFSRVLVKQASIYEAAAAFCLACAIAAPLAAFETGRSWLLYQGIGEVWGNPDPFAWLFRGSLLRAQVSAGHSLTFGYHMAIGFGLTMVLLRPLHSKRLSMTAAAWMWVGLLAAYSRAPWLAAGLFAVVSAVLLPGAASNLKRLIFVVAAGSAVVLMSPYGDAVIDSLPFIGSVDAENVTYRQQLAATSWNLIWRSPWFGDPLVLRDMEHLRQGQGIIDLVNSYASVTLFNGFVGLATFVGPMLIACWVAYSTMQKTEKLSELDSSLGAGLIAAMAATLFFIATSNIPWLMFAILGMLVAYIQLDRRVVAVITPVENKAAARPFSGSANPARPGRSAYRGPTRWLR